MAIYVSNTALESIPDSNFLNLSTKGGAYTVKSLLFKTDPAIVGIAKNPLKTVALHKDDKRALSVERIQIALLCIDMNPNINLTLPAGFKKDSDFGDQTEQAVKDFQLLYGIDQTGQVDALTIKRLDEVMAADFYDIKEGVYLREVYNTYAISNQTNAEGKYIYKLRYTDTNGVEQRVTYVSDIQDAYEVLNSGGSRGALVIPNSRVSNIAMDLAPNTSFPTLRLDPEFMYLQVATPAPKVPGSIPYTIQPGDSIVSIMNNFYYGGNLNIVDGPSSVFTIKNRTPRANTRMKFYSLMTYFFNIDGQTEHGVHFNNLNINNNTANTQALYNALSGIYLHENLKPNSTTSTSKLPNFYNFTQNISQEIPGYNLTFNGTGNLNQITLTPGATIWLPPRHFAEIMYSYTNFNPEIMLNGNELRTTPNITVNQIKSELTSRQAAEPGILQALFDPFGVISSIDIDTVAADISELYDDTLTFFKDSYNYLVQSLVDLWPRGVGAYAKVGGGVTWGIPVATNFETEFYFWRKVTASTELTVCVSQSAKFFVGLDTGVGVSGGVSLGKKTPKQLNLGVFAGASADLMAGFFIEGSVDFEFPIKQDNCALISMLMGALLTGAGGTLLQVGSFTLMELLKYFNVVDLDPYQYAVKTNLGMGVEGEASAEAEIGIRTHRQPADQTTDTNEEADKKKSWFNFNNILKYADIGVNGSLTGSLKLVDIEYTAEYDDNAMNPGTLTRRPKNITIQYGSSVQVNLTLGSQAGPLALLSGIGVPVEAANALLSFLSFDTGFGFYVKLAYDNTADPTPSNPNNFRLVPTSRLLKVGVFSGDTGYTQAGDEMYLYLDITQFKDLIMGTNGVNFTVENVVDLIDSFQYHKKVGIELKKTAINKVPTIGKDPSKLTTDVSVVYGGKVERDNKSYAGFLKSVNVDFGAFLDADITLKIAGTPISEIIVGAIKITTDLIAIWIAFLRSGAAVSDRNKLRTDLLNKFYLAFTKNIPATAAPDTTAATALYMKNKLDEVWLWFQNYTLNGVNIYQQYNYNSTLQANPANYKKEYTNDVFKYIMQIPVAANRTKNTATLTDGWGIDVIINYIFRFIVESLDINIALEGYSGISFSGSARASEGLKVAVKLDAGGGFFDRTDIINEGAIVFPYMDDNSDDSLKTFFQETLASIGYDTTADANKQNYDELIKYLFKK